MLGMFSNIETVNNISLDIDNRLIIEDTGIYWSQDPYCSG